MRPALLPLALVLLFTGCTPENMITARELDLLAVTAGDFDDVAAPLKRMAVNYTLFDGIITTATWDPDYDFAANQYTVEGLFASVDNMLEHDGVFVASGTRGLGERQYNGLDPDDQLVTDPAVIENVQDFVSRSRTVLATDWAYDLVEAAWPEYIDFVEDDQVLDDAQRGTIGRVSARVVDQQLADTLGMDVVSVRFDFSNWAVMQSVSDDVTVWLEGDVSYLSPDGQEVITVPGAPLLVSFEPAGGQSAVVYSSFHVDAQNTVVIDQILTTVVGDFEPQDPTSVVIEE